MSLLIKYRPPMLGEFVGASARKLASKLLKRRLAQLKEIRVAGSTMIIGKPLLIAVIGDFGCGKTTLTRLIGKGHFCSMADDYGPCGLCAVCMGFEEQFDYGKGCFETSRLGSRTPTTKSNDVYSFRVQDLANTDIDQLRELISVIGPSSKFNLPTFCRQFPEVVILDEAHRADKQTKQQALLDALCHGLFSSVILCVARANLHMMDEAFMQRFTPIYLDKPEFGELVAFAEGVAEKEDVRFAHKSVVEELVEGANSVPRNVLRLLDMATLEDSAITSAWVEVMRLQIQPPPSAGADQ